MNAETQARLEAVQAVQADWNARATCPSGCTTVGAPYPLEARAEGEEGQEVVVLVCPSCGYLKSPDGMNSRIPVPPVEAMAAMTAG